MVQKIYAFAPTVGTGQTTTFTVPADWNNASNRIICIGGGGGGRRPTANSVGGGGGGGGGYAELTNITLSVGVAYTLGFTAAGGTGGATNGTNGGTGGQAWFRRDGGTTAPTSSTQGALAAGGLGGGTGTSPTVATSGGPGGGSNVANIGIIIATGSAGGNGGNALGGGGGGGGTSISSTFVGGAGRAAAAGGGGGGGGRTSAGVASASSVGGNGGTGLNSTVGGTGGSSANGGAGANEAGGGGGAGRSNSTAGFSGGTGGPGTSARFVITHTAGTTGAIAVSTAIGFGGGGGGGGGNSTANSNGGTGGSCNGVGAYGGGGGGGGYGRLNGGTGGTGGLPLIVIIFQTAELYWIGGSGTWNNASTTNWSYNPGGTSAGIVPTAAWDAIFDASSDTGAGYTVTTGTGAACRSLIFSAPDQTMTLAGSSNITISVNMTLTAGRFSKGTYTGTLNFISTATGRTITTAGNTLPSIAFTGVGGGWTFQDNVTCDRFNHEAGTLNYNNRALTCFTFLISGSTTRTIQYGTTSSITITGGNTANVVIAAADLTNLTITGTIPPFNLTYAGGGPNTRVIEYGSTSVGSQTTFPALNIQGGTDFVPIFGRFASINFTGFSGTWSNGTTGLYGNLTISSGMTIANVNNVLSFLHTTGNATITPAGKTFNFPVTISGAGGTTTLAADLAIETSKTFTLTAGTLNLNDFNLTLGLFSSNNSNTRNIGTGTGGLGGIISNGTGTIWEMSTATNFSTSGGGDLLLTVPLNTATARTISHGQTAGGTESNAIAVKVQAGTGTCTIQGFFKNFNLSGFTGTLALSARTIYGDFSLDSGTIVTAGATATTFARSSTSQFITTSGVTLNLPITKSGTGTLVLADNLTGGTNTVLTLTQGRIDLSNLTITVPSVSTSNSNTRGFDFGTTGTITITGSGTAWNAATATNFSTTGTGIIDFTSASAATFAGGGYSGYPTLNMGGTGGLTVSGSNGFDTISNTVNATFTLTSGTTTTVNNFNLDGTVLGNVLLRSTTPGVQATLSKSSGTVEAFYIDIRDSNATGGATWLYDSATSINSGNNTGWIFIAIGGEVASPGRFITFFYGI